MNTPQQHQEKRSVRVKDFLDDFRAGMGDDDLHLKYHLTPAGLEKFYSMLIDRDILGIQELRDHYREEELCVKEPVSPAPSVSSFICPGCMASLEIMTAYCPSCGVSFCEPPGEEAQSASRAVEEPKHQTEMGDDIPTLEQALEGIGSVPANAEEPGAAVGEPEEPDVCDRSGHELNTAADMPGDAPLESSSSADLASDFLRADFSECQTSFDDTIDEVVPGMPLDYVDSSAEGLRNPDVRCETCEEPMRPSVRELYDQRYTKKAFIAAIACLILGFLGAFGVTFFDGYSFGRLVIVYLTGVSLMFGGVLSGVGSFLYLAREKVFLCPCCKRVYPRA